MQIISALLILLLHSNPDNVSSVVMSKGWYRIFYFIPNQGGSYSASCIYGN